MSDSTPQQRREALAWVLREHPPTYTTAAHDPSHTFYCSRCSAEANEWVIWTPEHVYEITAPLVESWLAEKDAQIERLSTSDWNGWADAINRARADERRRTAERVKDQVHAHISTFSLTRIPYLDVARICDEVGGSE